MVFRRRRPNEPLGQIKTRVKFCEWTIDLVDDLRPYIGSGPTTIGLFALSRDGRESSLERDCGEVKGIVVALSTHAQVAVDGFAVTDVQRRERLGIRASRERQTVILAGAFGIDLPRPAPQSTPLLLPATVTHVNARAARGRTNCRKRPTTARRGGCSRRVRRGPGEDAAHNQIGHLAQRGKVWSNAY